MLDTLTKHADNLKTILELEGEEGQFEYLIDIGKKKGSLEPQEKIDKNFYDIEPDLNKYIRRNKSNFKYETDINILIRETKITFIVLPTPSLKDGSFSNKFIL